MTRPVVGVVSPGAMGSALARALEAGGLRVVATVAGRSARTASLARGLELLPSLDDVVAESGLVLAVVPPAAADAVAEAIGGAATRSGARPLVAELNAIAPAHVERLAARLGAIGIELVDGSISGPPPSPEGLTTVYLAGRRAHEIAALRAAGVTWSVVGAEPGAASAVKMSTASVYKGQSAVLAQALRAAAAHGVLDAVVEDLRRSSPDLVARAPLRLQRLASVAQRYVGEMEEIASSQEAVGLTPTLFGAVAEIFAGLAASSLAAVPPEALDRDATLREILDRLA